MNADEGDQGEDVRLSNRGMPRVSAWRTVRAYTPSEEEEVCLDSCRKQALERGLSTGALAAALVGLIVMRYPSRTKWVRHGLWTTSGIVGGVTGAASTMPDCMRSILRLSSDSQLCDELKQQILEWNPSLVDAATYRDLVRTRASVDEQSK